MRYDLAHMYRNPAAYDSGDLMRAAEERGWEVQSRRGSHLTYGKRGWPRLLSIVAGNDVRETKRRIIKDMMIEEQSRGR